MAASVEDILSGFQINWIHIRDVDTKEILWQGNHDYSSPSSFHTIALPRKVLYLRAVTMVIHFSSVEEWANLKLVQTALYKGVPMDKWVFEYGPVYPDTNNSWETVVAAAPEIDMMSRKILNRNLVVVSEFYNGETLVSKAHAAVIYV